jgi:hypothetical protein
VPHHSRIIFQQYWWQSQGRAPDNTAQVGFGEALMAGITPVISRKQEQGSGASPSYLCTWRGDEGADLERGQLMRK